MGKKYLYDVVNIKEDITNALDLRHKEARKDNYKAATQGDAITKSIPGVVHRRMSVRRKSQATKESCDQSVKNS